MSELLTPSRSSLLATIPLGRLVCTLPPLAISEKFRLRLRRTELLIAPNHIGKWVTDIVSLHGYNFHRHNGIPANPHRWCIGPDRSALTHIEDRQSGD